MRLHLWQHEYRDPRVTHISLRIFGRAAPAGAQPARGYKSSGVAIEVPLVTSKWAGIKERAVLALLPVRCVAVQEGDPVPVPVPVVSMAVTLER